MICAHYRSMLFHKRVGKNAYSVGEPVKKRGQYFGVFLFFVLTRKLENVIVHAQYFAPYDQLQYETTVHFKMKGI